jgi:regulator of RNase E activity RraA
MVPKASPSFPNPTPTSKDLPESNAQDLGPYADHTTPETIVLISQPPNQSCAVVGGIMAARMKHLGARAIVVDGRVRDLVALADTGMPVWSRGTSVIGAGAETKFYAKEVALKIGDTVVQPGDIVMIDELERGVVVVPRGVLEEVLRMLPEMVGADEKVLEEVVGGGSVKEAFKRHRNV